MTKVLLKIALIAVGTSGLVSWAQGAPTISGVAGKLAQGQKLTITGAGFGTKAQAQPLVWDNFESGTNGAIVGHSSATVGKWDDGTGSNYVKYTSARAHNGKLGVLHDFSQTYNIALAKNGSFPVLYMDFWFNVDLADNRSRNFKLWRLYGDVEDLQMAWVYFCDQAVLNRTDENAGFAENYWGGDLFSPDSWHHVQFTFKQSSTNAADGTVRHFVDSKVEGVNSSAVQTRFSANQFDSLRIGHYWGTSGLDNCPASTGAKVYMDDVYVDTSWARVEIGNAATYAGSSHREILVPTSWTATQIDVTGATGSFSSGQTVYLYVTDSSGTTQVAGFPVTIGAAVAQPNPPEDVNAK